MVLKWGHFLPKLTLLFKDSHFGPAQLLYLGRIYMLHQFLDRSVSQALAMQDTFKKYLCQAAEMNIFY